MYLRGYRFPDDIAMHFSICASLSSSIRSIPDVICLNYNEHSLLLLVGWSNINFQKSQTKIFKENENVFVDIRVSKYLETNS